MAQLEIQKVRDDDRAVLALTGEVDLSTCARLASVLAEALVDAEVVVIDLAGVEFMDSSGIHALVMGHRDAVARGRRVHVANAVGPVGRVLDITGVHDLLRARSDLGGPTLPGACNAGDERGRV